MELFEIAGLELDVDIRGDGPPLLYLHPEHYAHLQAPFVDALSKTWKVYAPRHPGFDGRKPPGDFRRVDDIAYLYLDLLDQLALQDACVVGASFGGWIALEMAVRNGARLGGMGLIAPLGVKLGGREDRDFTDLSALPDAEAAAALFAGTPADFGTFSEAELVAVAQDRQFLAYYGWKPYLHNPSLARWLHRIDVPVQLLWGEGDGFVTADYGRRLAGQIPGAKIEVIAGAGHYPQIEKLEETVAALAGGLGG